MLDLMTKIKTFMAVQDAVGKIKKTGALSVLDASHVGTLLAILGSFYASVKELVPPQYGVAAGIGLSLLFLLYSFILKLHGQAAAPIPGIPALDESQVAALVAQIEAKHPELVAYRKAFAEALAAAKAAAPAADVPTSPQITK